MNHEQRKANYFSCCYWKFQWNVKVYWHIINFHFSCNSSLYKYGIICFSETSADTNYLTVLVFVYGLIRADHSSDQRKGGVCLYCKENLSLRQLDISYFSQCNYKVKLQIMLDILLSCADLKANKFNDFSFYIFMRNNF